MEQETIDQLAAITLLPYAWLLTLMQAHGEFIEDLLSEDLCPDVYLRVVV